jgi:hypothetical protein
MRKWKMTLDERTRAELGEPTRRERVQMEIEKEPIPPDEMGNENCGN